MRLTFLILIAIAGISCTPKEPLYHTQHYVFGTLVDISIYGEPDTRAEVVSNGIIDQYNALHQRLHAWQPSEIQTLNQAFATGSEAIDVSPDIIKMLTDITKLSNQSNGAFNPAIGKLIKRWGFQSDAFIPHQINHDAIKKLVSQQPQMSDIVISGNKIKSINPTVQLDLGGYAKGYALDIGSQYLRQQNIHNALINIGGNIIALGTHGDKPWRVGIQNPRQPNAIATIDLPSGWAIGTSGDYQRFFELEGKRYCHIINPSTGYPVQGMQSVTVLIPPQSNAGVLSDVASKPIFIADMHARIAAAKAMQTEYFLMIESNRTITVSKPMAEKLQWLDTQVEKNVKVVDFE